MMARRQEIAGGAESDTSTSTPDICALSGVGDEWFLIRLQMAHRHHTFLFSFSLFFQHPCVQNSTISTRQLSNTCVRPINKKQQLPSRNWRTLWSRAEYRYSVLPSKQSHHFSVICVYGNPTAVQYTTFPSFSDCLLCSRIETMTNSKFRSECCSKKSSMDEKGLHKSSCYVAGVSKDSLIKEKLSGGLAERLRL